MKQEVLLVEIRGVVASSNGCALFLGTKEKVFVISVEHSMGMVIEMARRGVRHERPLTHDLVTRILTGFNISIDRVIITEVRNSTFFARLILRQQLEPESNVVEIDARPSDCLALAVLQKRPIFVTTKLFDQVEDMSDTLAQYNDQAGESGESEPG